MKFKIVKAKYFEMIFGVVQVKFSVGWTSSPPS